MASRQTENESQSGRQLPGIQLPAARFPKLGPIPQSARIQKRPMSRPQQPASAKSTLIYVSATTPHMAVVKRVRKQLEEGIPSGPSTSNMSLPQRMAALRRDNASAEAGKEVTVLGTGKAIQKCLGVASWFANEKDCVVCVRTRTVGTVDDVIVEGDEAEDMSRVRRVSALEVVIRLM